MKKIILCFIVSLLVCSSSFGMLLKQNIYTKKYLKTYTVKKPIAISIFNTNLNCLDAHFLIDVLSAFNNKNQGKIKNLEQKIENLETQKTNLETQKILLQKQSDIIEDYLFEGHSPEYMLDQHELKYLEIQLQSIKKRKNKLE